MVRSKDYVSKHSERHQHGKSANEWIFGRQPHGQPHEHVPAEVHARESGILVYETSKRVRPPGVVLVEDRIGSEKAAMVWQQARRRGRAVNIEHESDCACDE